MARTMCYPAVLSAVALSTLIGAPGPAAAQPGAPPPPPPAYAAPPPAVVPVVIVAAPPRVRRWGIGLHLGGMGVESDADQGDAEAQKTDLGLVGVQLRFRLHRRWELELDLSHMEGELDGPGGLTRSSGAVILGGMFHINPDDRWLWSVLMGIGGARDRVWYEKEGDRVTQAEFAEGLFRLGVGLERRFDRWGLAAQLYGVGLERDEEELDGPAYIGRDGPVPEHSSGGLLQIVANYYF
ncbi:MAG TPA: hypothetical protein VK698_22765 [Kofleriaceae bacterium]|nr:hypothetical protein [Kofleriaceae bacterium]